MKQLTLLLSLLIFVASCGKKEDAPAGGTAATGSADSNRAKSEASVRAVYDAFNTGNYAELDKYIDPNFTEHTPWPGMEPGLAGLKKGFAEFRTAFPDLKLTANSIWVDGNTIIVHYTQTGTMSGPLMGMPATNKKMDIQGAEIIKVNADGKATDHWGYQEDQKMAQQMGWAPAPGAAPAPEPAAGGTTGSPKNPAPSGSAKKPAPEAKPKY